MFHLQYSSFFDKNNIHGNSVQTPLHTLHRGAKVQKYEQSKIGHQFYICGGINVEEHFGKSIKILHGCPIEG